MGETALARKPTSRSRVCDAFGTPGEACVQEASCRYVQPGTGYVPFPLAVEAVRQGYAGDPARPEAAFARDVLDTLRLFAGVAEEDADCLRWYAAAGTPLDVCHNVKAWIELAAQAEGRPAVVTLGMGRRGGRADLHVGAVPDPASEAYRQAVEETAKRAYLLLAERLATKEEC